MQFETIIEGLKVIAVCITSAITIFTVPKGIVKLYQRHKDKVIEKAEKRKASEDRENRQDEEIARIKQELCLLMYGVSACLDGLLQLNCNHSVPEVKERIDKYLNKEAHK